MANFIDESRDEEQETVDLFADQDDGAQDITEEPQNQEQEETVAAEAQEQVEEEDLPSKYKGKSVKDIIKMHQEAEKLIGRQAQEVGEVRKLFDEMVKRQLDSSKTAQQVATKEDEIDLLEDPEKYLNTKLEKHPAILAAKEQAMQLKQMQFADRLQKNFPDFQQTVQDPEFVDWVKASPVRLQLFSDADVNLNFDSAAELLNTWSLVQGTKTQKQQTATNEVVKQERKQALKAAAVNTGSAGVESRKTYRREDIRNLMIRDPDRYQAMQPEIMAAYAEGRVI